MRGSTIKKFRRAARQEARAQIDRNFVVKRRWYLNRFVFTAFAWPITQVVVLANFLGWYSLGVRWVEWCRRLSQDGRVLVRRRA